MKEQVKLVIETMKGKRTFVAKESPVFEVQGDFTQNTNLMKCLDTYTKKIKSLNKEWADAGEDNKARLRVFTSSVQSTLPKQIIHFSETF